MCIFLENHFALHDKARYMKIDIEVDVIKCQAKMKRI
jgi:hypothetical protein